MTEQLHAGRHPDADTLSGFVEGVLPEHERLACLAHFAECPDCREAVFLAHEPPPRAAGPAPARGRARWFWFVPALGTALAACLVVATVWVYRHDTPTTPTKTETARVTTPEQTAAANAPSISAKTQASLRRAPRMRQKAAVPPPPPPPPAAASPAPPQAEPAAGETLSFNIRHDAATPGGLPEVTGSVTDATGAAIPGATVTLRNVDGSVTSSVVTDTTGRFDVAGLSAGRYDVQVDAPGFQRSTGQVELQPGDLALSALALKVGTATETVEVAAANEVATAESQNSTTPNQHMQSEISVSGRDAAEFAKVTPGAAAPAVKRKANEPVSTVSVAINKRMLMLDASGAVLLSKNDGKNWKAIKPRWQGKVVRLAVVPEQASASGQMFQLTTDAGAVWLSGDGRRWDPAAARK